MLTVNQFKNKKDQIIIDLSERIERRIRTQRHGYFRKILPM